MIKLILQDGREIKEMRKNSAGSGKNRINHPERDKNAINDFSCKGNFHPN